PDDAAEDGPVPAEQAGPADDDTGDHAQVGGGLAADRGRLKERQVEPAGEAGQQPGQGVDRDQVAADLQAGPPARLGIRPEREGDGHQRADDGGAPALAAADVGHRLVGYDAAEDQDAAYRQVDAAGDDHEGHPDAQHGQDGGVLHDSADVEHGQEGAGLHDP